MIIRVLCCVIIVVFSLLTILSFSSFIVCDNTCIELIGNFHFHGEYLNEKSNAAQINAKLFIDGSTTPILTITATLL